MTKLISKFVRVAVEGDTTDGRDIERAWIQQMAKNYSQAKYGARIWLEHFRSLLPDSPFRAYGDVVALKAEEVDIDGEKKMALFAQLAPTPDLVAMNRAGQKLYTSMEIDPNFAKSGECYLTGLAVTDSPASLGTEMLTFAAQHADKNPLKSRKQKAENLFTAVRETAFEFEEEDTGPELEDGKSFFKKIMDKIKGDKKEFTGNLEGVMCAVEAIAEAQRDLMDKFNAFSKGGGDAKQFRKEVEDLGEKLKQTNDELTKFRKEVEETPAPQTIKRPAASGGNAGVTDC